MSSSSLDNMSSNTSSLDIVETENDDFKENYDKIMVKIKKKKLTRIMKHIMIRTPRQIMIQIQTTQLQTTQIHL